MKFTEISPYSFPSGDEIGFLSNMSTYDEKSDFVKLHEETILENEISYFFLGVTLFTLIPAISAGVRRLHDTNRSGFILLISFIPFIGGLVLLFFLIPEGTKGKNRFGPDPLKRVTRKRKS